MRLVLTSTAATAKRLTGVLAEGWRVEPCTGMVRALPAQKLGIDVGHEFRPTLAIAEGKTNRVRRLMKAIRACEAVYVATPPTVDGETMAWHVLALSQDMQDKPVCRVLLPALTPDAIRDAFVAPRPLDMRWIEAHMTRRIIERMVNWSVNEQAERALGFKTALSWYGMVALRIISERDTEMAAFTPQTAWRASVTFLQNGVRFRAPVLNARGSPLTLRSEAQARQLEVLLRTGTFWIERTGQTLQTLPAPGAHTLIELVERAAQDLALSPERVLSLLGTLYEVGWITHPDVGLPASLSDAAQTWIRHEYGTDYLNAGTRVQSGIAPTDVRRVPEARPGDGAALYGLIWRSFVAAHMMPAQNRLLNAYIRVGSTQRSPYPLQLRAELPLPYFDGWRRVRSGPEAETSTLPVFTEGCLLRMAEVVIQAVASEPPRRFTRAALVGALADAQLNVEQAVAALAGLLTADYVSDDDVLMLTERGRVLADYLTSAFADLTSPAQAAYLHAEITSIASGDRERLAVLQPFWARFGEALRPASASPVTSGSVSAHKPLVLRPVEGG